MNDEPVTDLMKALKLSLEASKPALDKALADAKAWCDERREEPE